MENTIEYKNKILKWDYKICPCLDCPIYPTKRDWEEEAEKDVRKDKCYTSRCTYNKENARMVAEGLQFWKNNYYCEECDDWIPPEDLDGKYCPNCGIDLLV